MPPNTLSDDLALPGHQSLGDQELVSRFRQLQEPERLRLLGIARAYAGASGRDIEAELPHVLRQHASGELPA